MTDLERECVCGRDARLVNRVNPFALFFKKKL